MSDPNETPKYKEDVDLIPSEGLTGQLGEEYLPSLQLIAAVNVAWTLEIPLLLTGEPGCGKTDFVYAVASAMDPEKKPLECYIRSDTRAKDLLYHYDAIRRFGDAQLGGEEGRKRSADARKYVKLRDLGVALTSKKCRVVLIDEIDKAPRDLPNDLLRELDEGSFEIPEIDKDDESSELKRIMRRPEGAKKPLVIITSNVERQLPDPFLRRCAFYHIEFPEPEELQTIVELHCHQKPPLELDKVVRVFLALRQVTGLTKKPGTSELLNWADSLSQLFDPTYVQDRVSKVHQAIRESGDGELTLDRKMASWLKLPGLTCLIKLREDLERVRG
jgi:MoxR-like ATPase